MSSTVIDLPQTKPKWRKKRGPHVRTRPQLLTRARLDSRLNAVREFDAIASGVARDIAPDVSQLSTVQLRLIEAFAGLAIQSQTMTAKLLLGNDVNVADHSQVVSTMVRVASRLGMHRVARDVPSLEQYLRTKQEPEE